MPPLPGDDQTFDSDKYVQTKEHERDIGELKAVVSKLDERFGDDACFGDTFLKMAEKDRRVDQVIKDALRRLIKSDDETAAVLKGHVEKIDRDWRAKFTGRIGFAVWSLFLAIAALIAGHFIH